MAKAKGPSPLQERAASRAMRTYKQTTGGEEFSGRRSSNPLFDPVTEYPGKSVVGGRNTGLQPTPLEKLSKANTITKKGRS